MRKVIALLLGISFFAVAVVLQPAAASNLHVRATPLHMWDFPDVQLSGADPTEVESTEPAPAADLPAGDPVDAEAPVSPEPAEPADPGDDTSADPVQPTTPEAPADPVDAEPTEPDPAQPSDASESADPTDSATPSPDDPYDSGASVTSAP